MKKIALIALVVGLFACHKEDIQPPVHGTPINNNPTPIDSLYSIAGETWVITKVLNTSFNEETRTDTLVFVNSGYYTFNGIQSTYGFYATPYSYKLNLNNTPWGNIGGDMYSYNITQGDLTNSLFTNTFTNEYAVRIWMKRL